MPIDCSFITRLSNIANSGGVAFALSECAC
jgi:hypothetical protein